MTDVPAILHTTGIHPRLTGIGLGCLTDIHAELVECQDARIAAGDAPSRIPLLWRSLAETVGLAVDNDGRIIDGPRAAVPGI